LKYMLLLANSATACEKFARNGDGLKTLMGLLENHVNDGKEILDVVKRMMVGSKTAVRTELTAQLEEQGYIEAVMALLKEKNTPMPMKVAGVEVLKVRHLPQPPARSPAALMSCASLRRRCCRMTTRALLTLSRRSWTLTRR